MKSSARRSFLKAMGGGAAALPFISMLSDSVAQEGGDDLPLKFIGVYHPHGVAAEHWVMQGGDSETDFDLHRANSSLAPFDDAATYGKSFKDKILLVRGLDLLSNANGHDTAGTILTGSSISGQSPGHISLDQYLAIEAGLGAETRLDSIALSVGIDTTEVGTTLSYGPGGVALPKVIDPVQAFDLLFAGFVIGDDPAAAALAARQRAKGASIIDFVRGDIARLNPRLAPREQQKLEQHLTSLRELEKQISEPVSVGANCGVPSAPNAANFPKNKMYNGGEPYFSAISDAFIDVLAQAMACDITRFGTLFLNDLAYAGNPLGLPADNHGSVAHTYNPSPIGNNGRPGDGVPSTWVPLAQLNQYNYQQIARLMQRLDEFGALDSTLIYASSDMGNPSLHSTNNVPTLLAGGVNGKFRMGRRLRMVADCPESSPWCSTGEAVYTPTPNNRLLVSIAQAFGQDIETFGNQPDASLTTGELSELV